METAHPQKKGENFKIQKVGIALAAYQPEISLFEEQLRSIQDQTWQDWVCVITSDSPLGLLLNEPKLAPFQKDPRFVWLENPTRLGHKKNFEKGIQALLSHQVDAIACSDQDDVWYPNKLSESIRALEQAGRLSLIHCDMHVLRGGKMGDQTAWQEEKRGVQNTQPVDLITRNVVAGCAMLFDSELARRYPVIPEGCEYHDHWYALVASYHGGVYPLFQPLYAYRQHLGNTLGVTPYRGRFWLPQGVGLRGLIQLFVKSWEGSKALAVATDRGGLPVLPPERRCYLSCGDGGIGLLILGLRCFFRDPALSRAFLKRAIGKLVSIAIPSSLRYLKDSHE